MPTNPNFEDTRARVDQYERHVVLGPVDDPDQIGVHGTQVVVDFDSWNAAGAWPDDCPVDAISVDPGEQAVFDILERDYR